VSVGCTAMDPEMSTGDSECDYDVHPMVVLSELGMYCFGPLNKKESIFAERYSEMFWHTRSWSLIPRQPFSGPPARPKIDIGGIPSPVQIFTWLWTEPLQQKIVK
jgi:hypothetical protein